MKKIGKNATSSEQNISQRGSPDSKPIFLSPEMTHERILKAKNSSRVSVSSKATIRLFGQESHSTHRIIDLNAPIFSGTAHTQMALHQSSQNRQSQQQTVLASTHANTEMAHH